MGWLLASRRQQPDVPLPNRQQHCCCACGSLGGFRGDEDCLREAEVAILAALGLALRRRPARRQGQPSARGALRNGVCTSPRGASAGGASLNATQGGSSRGAGEGAGGEVGLVGRGAQRKGWLGGLSVRN